MNIAGISMGCCMVYTLPCHQMGLEIPTFCLDDFPGAEVVGSSGLSQLPPMARVDLSAEAGQVEKI